MKGWRTLAVAITALPFAAQASTAASTPVVTPSGAICHVALPNGISPRGEVASSRWLGNGRLFTQVYEDGIVRILPPDVRPDGSLEMKFPWWGLKVAPKLVITGRRLDGAAPRLSARTNHANPGPGLRRRFWSSALRFPTEGCWRIEARAGSARLVFAAVVRRFDA